MWVIENSEYIDAGMAAVEKLAGNVRALTLVAVSLGDSDVRMAAVEKLAGNVDALKAVAKNSGRDNVHYHAIALLDSIKK
jgi:hypothetical protein